MPVDTGVVGCTATIRLTAARFQNRQPYPGGPFRAEHHPRKTDVKRHAQPVFTRELVAGDDGWPGLPCDDLPTVNGLVRWRRVPVNPSRWGPPQQVTGVISGVVTRQAGIPEGGYGYGDEWNDGSFKVRATVRLYELVVPNLAGPAMIYLAHPDDLEDVR